MYGAPPTRSDEALFVGLVRRHQATVRTFLRRAGGDAGLADDLAQETFLAAWSDLRGVLKAESPRAWLCRIAWRKLLTHRRSARRGLNRDGAFAALSPQTTTTDAASFDIEKALRGLPPDQRAAMMLCLGADFTHQECAEVLGLPLGTIKSHILRGRERLKDLLGAADGRH